VVALDDAGARGVPHVCPNPTRDTCTRLDTSAVTFHYLDHFDTSNHRSADNRGANHSAFYRTSDYRTASPSSDRRPPPGTSPSTGSSTAFGSDDAVDHAFVTVWQLLRISQRDGDVLAVPGDSDYPRR